MRGGPVTERVFDPDVVQCPFPTYETLRAECPVSRVPGDDELYLVVGYDDVVDALQDVETFSSKAGPGLRQRPSPAAKEVLAKGHRLVRTLLTNDPPGHTRYRRLVSKALTARAVAAMEPGVRAVIDRLVDGIEADLAGGGAVDFVEAFAQPLPLIVIADFLGVPGDDLPTFKKWSDDAAEVLGGAMSEERQIEVNTSLVELLAYFADKATARRDAPGADFLSTLVTADNGQLTVEEIIAIAYVVLVAGNETTVNLLSSVMHLLLQDPTLMSRVRGDRALIPRVIEEALRLQSPVQGFPRLVTRETEIGGVTVPAGAQVMLMIGAANRDPAYFQRPDSVDLEHERPHLAFGKGPHFCLGATLSRLEAGVALNVILDRFNELELAEPDFIPTYADNAILRSMLRLPITTGRN
jgi:cytochrome P450